jgi:glycine cleavage system aminomethyltransferase T
VRTVLRRSPAAALSSASGAAFIEEAGWELPASYGDEGAERAAIREAVSITDLSARAKIDIRGDLAAPLTAAVGSVARLADEWALVLGRPGEEAELLRTLEAAAGLATMVTDATHLYAGFGLVGPRLSDLLQRVTSWDPGGLGPGEAACAPIVEIPAVVVRPDLAIPILEVYVPSEFGRYSWGSLAGVIAGLGGGPVGWQVLREEGWS